MNGKSFASANLTAGQLNALVKKIGGKEKVLAILRGMLNLEVKPAASLVVADLDLSVRARHLLARMSIETVRQLIEHTADELLAQNNLTFTATQLDEIQRKLAQLGLHLKGDKSNP